VLLLKLTETSTPIHFTATVSAYLKAIAQTQSPENAKLFEAVLTSEATADEAIAKLPVDDHFKHELRAQLCNTATPTILKAGSQINVIPSEADAFLDARLLPGWTHEAFLKELQAIFDAEADIEFVDHSDAVEADPASPLFDTIQNVLKQHKPEATLVPYLITGGTDGEHIARLGTKVYGFAPELFIEGVDDGNRVHGHDERVHIHSLQWGTRVLFDVVAQFVSHNP
jgi:acetylornithine deacetylase/succinyl-diaminopimelate desuccinylase-like protein